MTPIGVMHLTDTLDAGGMERVAVNLVNLLPTDRFRATLCTTRRDGSLAGLVAEHVGRVRLNRRRGIDIRAVAALAAFIRTHEIRILHAHGTSIFIASIAALLPPHPSVIWHDHFGEYGIRERAAWLYGPIVRRARAVIAVNRSLVDWSRDRLGVSPDRLSYVPNFVCEPPTSGADPDLPGSPGSRVVCVANLRPQKDHPTLIRAFVKVARHVPDAHLLIVGSAVDPDYERLLRFEVARLGLADTVSFLGERRDVPAILSRCDVGVLSSRSEGLPLALIEYGMAGLPAVATRVGQCADALDHGAAGVLVEPGSDEDLAVQLVALLRSPASRVALGAALQRRVQRIFNAEAIVNEICALYERVLERPSKDALKAA